MHKLAFMFVALAIPAALCAQANPLGADIRADYISARDFVIRSAEKMPEAAFAFRPTPEVRTFGQIVAHVADDQYNLCAPVRHEVRSAAYSEIEHTLTTKADLVAALRKAFAYCDAAYDALSDANAAELVQFGTARKTRMAMLSWNMWHTWEHYGNLVVYLRMKGLVPPSSERSK
jgi:uncharacterized damage-inducible protein DinB